MFASSECRDREYTWTRDREPRYARKKGSADGRSLTGTEKGHDFSARFKAGEHTVREKLTKEAANATEEGRSRHASESLNFFSSSSEPMALAAVEGMVCQRLSRRPESATQRLCRAKTYPCSFAESALAAAGRHESNCLRRRPSSADEVGIRQRPHSRANCRGNVACTRLANVGELGSVAPGKDGVHELRLERRDILVCCDTFLVSESTTPRTFGDQPTHPRRPSSWTRSRSWRFFVPLLA